MDSTFIGAIAGIRRLDVGERRARPLIL